MMKVKRTKEMIYSAKDIRKLILPLIMEQFLVLLVGMADTIMISSVGEAAVSGVSLVDTINILVINIFTAFATGGAVVAGHFLGQKDLKSASKSAWQMILFTSVISIIVSVLFIAFHNPILHFIFGKVEAGVMSSAKDYLIITALSMFPLGIYNGCAALFRTMGNSKITMWISILMNIINICGNAILIYGFHWGAAGAATSTTISRMVAAAVIFVLLFQKKRIINFKGQITFRFHGNIIKKILYIGVPNGLENSLFQLGKILLLSLVSTFGTFAMAANAVDNTLAAFNVLPGIAINNGLLSIAAVCIGAGEYGQARYYTRKLMIFGIGCTAFISAIMYVTAPWLMSLYHLSPEAAELGIQVLRLHNIMAVVVWIPSFTIPNTLRAAGDVIWTMGIAVVSMWIFRIMIAYFFSYKLNLGLMGVWVAMTIDWAFRAICYTLRYKGTKWERIMKNKD